MPTRSLTQKEQEALCEHLRKAMAFRKPETRDKFVDDAPVYCECHAGISDARCFAIGLGCGLLVAAILWVLVKL